MALSRVRRGTQPKAEPALKTRARLRQSRAGAARVAVTAQDVTVGRFGMGKFMGRMMGVHELTSKNGA